MSKTFTAWAHRLHGTTSIIDVEKGMSKGSRSADGNSNQSNLMETTKNTEIAWTWGQIKLTINKWTTKETGRYNQIYLQNLSDFKLLALWPEGYKKIKSELNQRAPLPPTAPQTGPCQAGREGGGHQPGSLPSLLHPKATLGVAGISDPGWLTEIQHPGDKSPQWPSSGESFSCQEGALELPPSEGTSQGP